MDPQAFWDGEDHLPMCDRKTDFFGNVDSSYLTYLQQMDYVLCNSCSNALNTIGI